ncbi:xanthine dehydrogenase small subunit [Shimia marina]|uniref:4-hydroxybenzoyl-CoA reductase subunit gamma n=1 Tax=Shimia marina TaxID=321267 RepID=A0A0P1ET64_9RHOB|nr:xanthine dehydrogenase small subunit [Shimia marina]CUH53225.1 4-hydroxybenzoyl-CoA reductase subunit gamma [Shimia marina]SFD82063.1 xanthine dehydrogenase small subunit [Shimia marina]
MQHRSEIRFLLNGRDMALSDVGADDTLLDFLRLDQRLTGSKEGCAEGDCGACTVMVGRLTPEGLRYETVNACIRFLASLDGCHVVTIEYLGGPNGRLSPVQQAMVEYHGSQCGFCTPGIVMSLYALWMAHARPTVRQVESALQGNLCRCTGYAPIIRAAQAVTDYGTASAEHLATERDSVTARLTAMRDGRRVDISKGDSRAILPADVDDLAAVLKAAPEATIVAGSTDVGLWVTKFLKRISSAVFIGQLDGLKEITVTEDAVTFGAGVTYTEAQDVIAQHYPHLVAYWDRIAGWQVRNMGTIGGNIANGSPIGDTPPVLIALGASITLRKGDARRQLPLEAFFLDYGKQDRVEGEFVESITIPRVAGGYHAAYKISKRREEDISSVAVGMQVTVEAGVITAARLAFGGMAGVPARAAAAEAALLGQSWSEASLLAAAEKLPEDFQPLSDMRATADYRMKVAQNLFRRFWLEQSGADARLERA